MLFSLGLTFFEIFAVLAAFDGINVFYAFAWFCSISRLQ